MSTIWHTGHATIEIHQGDITRQQVDAIVNAANARLAGGGGVDGAIHRAGGPAIMAETRQKYPDGCPTGSAVISGAGDLPARFVLHAVGPVWNGGGHGEAEQLTSVHQRCLELARDNQCHSIAFPAISCGVYGYPIDQAAGIAMQVAGRWGQQNTAPSLIQFVLFSSDVLEHFRNAANQILENV